ncbi:Arylesterase [Cooperia oncophora]
MHFFRLSMDINKRVYNHRPGACRKVEGIQYGAEDIALLEDEGIAIVTSGIVYMEPRKKEVKGQLFLYDFRQNGTWRAVPMKINGKYDQENFHPHGISHVITPSGARFFVIVHSKKFEHSVMILDWNRKNWLELDLVRIIKDEKFIRPNDLVAIDENSFILTNDGYAQTSFFNILELISSYPSGSVVYYDGKASSYMISRTVSPNGIILNKERTHVIISHVNSETISVYKLTKDNHSLSRVVDVPILTTADNFCVDKSGAIWTGAHPVLKDAFSLLSNFDDVNAKAPSQDD